MERSLAVIPVRLAASRLPGKPLAILAGRSVVEWVHRRTVAADVFDSVVVATPDEEIAAAVTAFGGDVVITASDHITGTDRVAEVARREPTYDVIANVQGDQPFVDETMLTALVAPYRDGDRPDMVTIGAPLAADALGDENTVKVLINLHGDAIYFSRSPIPNGLQADEIDAPVRHHLGLYAFTSSFLQEYAALSPTPLERIERLEQLRVLEHGYRIRVMTVPSGRLLEVNTPEDLEAARAKMESDHE
jgi:3-deoxy-manno-octulosonate cytidylyltransferase (CMP-KDO synthetase)